MDWDDWKPIYNTIVDRLHLDQVQDENATELLSEILEPVNPEPLLQQLQRKITNRSVIVCGAGPSLERHIQTLKEEERDRNATFIAADGAVSVLLEQNCQCNIITTDLDSDAKYIIEAIDKGALAIVHGHGDNIPRIREIVPSLGDVLGSTQVRPTNRTFLWGGFTDGDRACHIAAEYGPSELILAGMDFGEVVGKWSKPNHSEHFQASTRKRIKLQIAEELISSLLQQMKSPYIILK
jgi:uncharacterized Rossmann fold enzyme